MDTPRLRIHLTAALDTPDIRKACAAIERLPLALDLLDDMTAPALEILEEYVEKVFKDRKGAMAKLGIAYVELIDEHIREVHRRTRLLDHGIGIVP